MTRGFQHLGRPPALQTCRRRRGFRDEPRRAISSLIATDGPPRRSAPVPGASTGARVLGLVDREWPALTTPPEAQEPIRAELFSVERLEQHAESLAAAQRVTAEAAARAAARAARRATTAGCCSTSYRAIAAAIREERAITPAAEWLVDNFHIVEEQIREIRDDLPPGFYRELPKLADGPLAGYPRVFGIAWAFVAHTDSRFDPETLRRFVRAYQRVQPLTIGELWAVAITLRIVLVENLRRLAERIVQRPRGAPGGRRARRPAARARRRGAEADATTVLAATRSAAVADGLRGPARPAAARSGSGGDAGAALAGRAPRGPGHDRRRDRPRGASAAGRDERDGPQRDHEHAPACRRSTGRSSSRASAWSTRCCAPTATSPRWTSPTRDRYRHAIEELARGSRPLGARGRARGAVGTARRAPRRRATRRPSAQRDPGYYLIAERPPALRAGARLRVRDCGSGCAARYVGRGTPGYLGTHRAPQRARPRGPARRSRHGRSPALRGSCVLALLALVPASDLADRAGQPRRRSSAVRPARAAGARAARRRAAEPAHDGRRADAADRARPRSRSRSSGSRCTTWRTRTASSASRCSPTGPTRRPRRMPDDDELLAAAARRHRAPEPTPRTGAGRRRPLLPLPPPPALERARRALDGLGAQARQAARAEPRCCAARPTRAFFRSAARPPVVPPASATSSRSTPTRGCRAARRGGWSARWRIRSTGRGFDPRRGRVVDGLRRAAAAGHAVAAGGPRGLAVPAASSRVRAGIDPYAVGGLRRLPGSLRRGLLHRQGHLRRRRLRGGARRAGPREHAAQPRPLRGHLRARRARHRHRARRGVPVALRRRRGAPASLGARRLAAAAVDPRRGRRVGAASAPLDRPLEDARQPAPDAVGAGRVPRRSSPAGPLPVALAGDVDGVRPRDDRAAARCCPSSRGIVPRRRGISKRSHVRAVGADLVAGRRRRCALTVTLLAHQAWLMADAIVAHARTACYVHAPAAARVGDRGAGEGPASTLDLAGFYRRMAGGVALAVAAAALVALRCGRESLAAGAAPFVVLWVLSPVVARWISLPPRASRLRAAVAPRTRALLRLIARRTWRFFETFVGAGGPRAAAGQLPGRPEAGRRASHVADQHRPLSAVDRRRARLRLDRHARRPSSGSRRRSTTMSALERFRGHFYNWYDTRDLRPLEPRYVSTVDSGNLAGHLIALAQACREMAGGRRSVRRGARRHRATRSARAASRPRALPTTGARRRSRGGSSTRRSDAVGGALDGAPRTRPGAGRTGSTSSTTARRHGRRHRANAARGARRRRGGRAAALVRRRCGRRSRATQRDVGLLMPWARVATPRRCRRSGSSRRAATAGRSGALAESLDDDELRLATRRRVGATRHSPTRRERGALRRAARPPAGSRSPARRASSFDDDGVRLPLRPDAQALLDRLPGRRRRARPELLRPPRLRGAPRELRRDRQGRRAGVALVPARPRR